MAQNRIKLHKTASASCEFFRCSTARLYRRSASPDQVQHRPPVPPQCKPPSRCSITRLYRRSAPPNQVQHCPPVPPHCRPPTRGSTASLHRRSACPRPCAAPPACTAAVQAPDQMQYRPPVPPQCRPPTRCSELLFLTILGGLIRPC